MKRREGESYEAYKARRKAANAETERKLRRGFWLHKNGQSEQPYGELSSGGYLKPYTRMGHRRAAAERRLKQLLVAHIFVCILAPKETHDQQ